MKCSRLRVLKALVKSTCNRNLSFGWIFWSLRMDWVAWIVASQPPRVLTPSWCGSKKVWAWGESLKARHLAARRRKTSPTAIGRMAPTSFFLSACRRPPQKKGAISLDKRPAAAKLTNLVTADKVCDPWRPFWQKTASFKNEAWKPEGPAAVPSGKDRMAALTSFSEKFGQLIKSRPMVMIFDELI